MYLRDFSTSSPTTQKAKRGRPFKPLEDPSLDDQSFKLRTEPLLQKIHEVLDKPENENMDFLTTWAKVGRRIVWDQKSRHKNIGHYKIFNRILSGEDVFQVRPLKMLLKVS